jgi:hypothetical protein
MKQILLSLLICISILSVGGCWVAHTANDRPELRANIGKKGTLTAPCVLFRDRGGRLHLEEGEMPAGCTLVEKLPAATPFEIKEVVYRISDPGRHDYYVIEVSGAHGRSTVEVTADNRKRPAWSYEKWAKPDATAQRAPEPANPHSASPVHRALSSRKIGSSGPVRVADLRRWC